MEKECLLDQAGIEHENFHSSNIPYSTDKSLWAANYAKQRNSMIRILKLSTRNSKDSTQTRSSQLTHEE